MPGVSRVDQDSAGGLIIGDLAPTVIINGTPVTVKGAQVTGHGEGLHASPVMVGASTTVFANKIAVCRQGDEASCGHTSSGSSDVIVG